MSLREEGGGGGSLWVTLYLYVALIRNSYIIFVCSID